MFDLRNLTIHYQPDFTTVASIPLDDGRMVRVAAEFGYEGTSASAELMKFLVWYKRQR